MHSKHQALTTSESHLPGAPALRVQPLVATLMDSHLDYISVTPAPGISLPPVLIFHLQII